MSGFNGKMHSSVEKTWSAAQELLRTMLNADIYNLWFQPVRAIALEKDVITLEVANDFCEVWLKDNYHGLLRDVLTHASGQQLQIKFRVANLTPPVSAVVSENARAKSKASAE